MGNSGDNLFSEANIYSHLDPITYFYCPSRVKDCINELKIDLSEGNTYFYPINRHWYIDSSILRIICVSCDKHNKLVADLANKRGDGTIDITNCRCWVGSAKVK